MSGEPRRIGTLTVTSSVRSGDTVVIHLAGELDLNTVPAFSAAVDEALLTAPTAIDLDLGDLSFIDSSGVGAYVGAYRRARLRSVELTIGERSPLVQRVLEVSGVEAALQSGGLDS
jgi:anti-anti-sigma factor